MEQTLYLSLKKNGLHHFFPLFQQGVIITTQVGVNIQDLLSLQLEILPEYVENRIQTIFLDGEAVDDLGEAVVRDGSTVALSAAMPGLVGATLRRGGAFASLRQSITFSQGGEAIPQKKGRIVLKLFNLLVSELGPPLLAQGVWLKGGELNRFLGGLTKDFWDECREVVMNGIKIDVHSDMSTLRFEKDGLVLLKVTSIPTSDM
jgi:hypothetical protein